MRLTLSINRLREMACSGTYAVRKQDLLTAANDLEFLQAELEKEKARLDWLLPRQHSHHTRQSIDNELADPAQPNEKVLEDIIRREMIRDTKEL